MPASEVSLAVAFTAGLALGALGLALLSQRKRSAPAVAEHRESSVAVDKAAALDVALPSQLKSNSARAPAPAVAPCHESSAAVDTAATEAPKISQRGTPTDLRFRAAADAATAIARARRLRENSDTEAEDDDESPVTLSWSPVSRGACATLIIFGADGNLSQTRVLPTLADLWHRGLLPHDVLVFGYARPVGAGGVIADTDDFRDFVSRCCSGTAGAFTRRCHYMTGQFDDVEAIGRLLKMVRGLEADRLVSRRQKGIPGRHRHTKHAEGGRHGEADTCPRVRMYYAAVPSFVYASLAMALCENGAAFGGVRLDMQPSALGGEILAAAERSLPRDDVEERFVFEKPFGRDTESCTQLLHDLSMLPPRDVFWMDHYLGKELVMNLLVLRFANIAFGSLWNRHAIKAVQVIFKETRGVEGRGGYFDQYGIIRDVMQNHLLQMMALVAMEQPLSLSAEHIRKEKLKVLQSVAPLELDDLVIGQYTSSPHGCGYVDEASVQNKASTTETFAAAVLHVDNPRWAGVPFVLKAGHGITENKVELRVQFHRVPGVVRELRQCEANELVVRVQPEEAIYWKVQNKVPGLKSNEVEQMRMDLLYSRLAKRHSRQMPKAYERLLLEVLANDHSHFVSAEELDASWRIFTPALHQLQERGVQPEPYPFGSRGPAAADDLARRYGMRKFGGGLTPYISPFNLNPEPMSRGSKEYKEQGEEGEAGPA